MLMIEQQAITGAENYQAESFNPKAALFEFYRAFNTQNMALMENNWSQSNEASMSNPLGGIKRGWDEIRQVYTNIFHGKSKVYVEFHDYSIHQMGDMFCAVGRERGTLKIGEQVLHLAIRTSRTYSRTDNKWQQIHHHGSIDNPALLKQYQQLILSTKQDN